MRRVQEKHTGWGATMTVTFMPASKTSRLDIGMMSDWCMYTYKRCNATIDSKLLLDELA